jgi:FtsP/CotA-like multicopper oxidase with cupredoxin domain
MTISRRNFLKGGAAAIAGSALATTAGKANASTGASNQRWWPSYSGGPADLEAKEPGMPGKHYRPVVVPSGRKLPFKIVDGVKVFHLIAEEFEHEFMPGLKATVWSYNKTMNSNVIEAVEGDRIRIYVTNKLSAPTSVHWHGLFLPNGMDGVSGLTQRPIPPGETFKYEWTIRQSGTFMYHSHYDTMTQEGMGLTGLFIIHPRNPTEEDLVDRDFAIILNEYRIDAGTSRPNPNEMTDFNILTMNGHIFPAIEPLVAKSGDRVRIRIGNLSAMDHHPIHLHGYKFKITATDGEKIPVTAQWPEITALVAVGQTRDLEFIADAPGDWAMHCHMTHHIMNQMGHEFPNVIGADMNGLDRRVQSLLPGYMSMGETGMGEMAYMRMPMPENTVSMAPVQLNYGRGTMGGMFTVLKVRDNLTSYKDPGWYRHPSGTRAETASVADLRKDGIKV